MSFIQNTFTYTCVGLPGNHKSLPGLKSSLLIHKIGARKKTWKLKFLYTGIN